MELSRGIKWDWWLKASLRLSAKTMIRPLPRLSRWVLLSVAVSCDKPWLGTTSNRRKECLSKCGFRWGYLNEDPSWFCKSEEGKVSQLKKTLYVLKQSSTAWFKRFKYCHEKVELSAGQVDHILLTKHAKDSKKSILILYVDDMIITWDDIQEIEDVKKHLRAELEVKELSTIRYLLGMKVARSKQGIFISQRKYALHILKETGKFNYELAGT